jgi:hypothetical protein
MKAPVLAASHLKGGTWTLGAVAVGLRPNEAAHRAKQTASRGGHGMSGPPFLNRFSIIVPHGTTPGIERSKNTRCVSAVQRNLVKIPGRR